MLLIVDKNGNVVPAASIQFAGRILHAGNNVWRVSQAGVPLKNEYIRTVTLPYTVTRDSLVTLEEATRILTEEKLRFVSREGVSYEFTKDKFREFTRPVTIATTEKTVTKLDIEGTVTKDIAATLTLTDLVTRDRTVTKDIPATRDLPEFTTTREYSRDKQITVTAQLPYFEVTCPSIIVRGQAFNLTLQAKNSDGSDDTSYAPASTVYLVGIAYTGYSEDDEIVPTEAGSSGWVNGSKTISCTVSGASGIIPLHVGASGDRFGYTGTTCADSTTTVNPSTNMNIQGRSYNFFSGSYWETGSNDLSGWQSEYVEARNPTVDSSVTHYLGAYQNSGFNATHTQLQLYAYGWKTGAQVHRAYMGFSISWEYEDLISGGYLKFTSPVLSGSENDSVAFYLLEDEPTGATVHEKFEDLESKIASGTYLGTIADDNWSGEPFVNIPASALNEAAFGTLHIGAIVVTDKNGSNYSYPGSSQTVTKQRGFTGTPSLVLVIEPS